MSAGAASAQRLSAASKCEAAKNQEARKYAACLHMAAARLIKTRWLCSVATETRCFRDDDCPLAETCLKDTTKVAAAVAKCEAKFETKWGKLTQKAEDALDPCPDGLLADDILGAVDTCVANVAGGLAGEGILTGDELLTCKDDLAACACACACACDAVPQGQRLKTGQTQCWNASGTLILCPGTGQDGELQKGLTVSFTDNGNGTMSDSRTGLMWERHNDGGGINDKDARFTWYNAFNKIRVMNGSATGCIAAGNPSSCCTGAGTGSGCTAFAGHTDWRLPNVNEMQSLANYGTVSPATHAAFNSSCTTSCTTCSCTQSSGYWSATTQRPGSGGAWHVNFSGGRASGDTKAHSYSVRAVRSGS